MLIYAIICKHIQLFFMKFNSVRKSLYFLFDIWKQTEQKTPILLNLVNSLLVIYEIKTVNLNNPEKIQI